MKKAKSVSGIKKAKTKQVFVTHRDLLRAIRRNRELIREILDILENNNNNND